MAKSPFSNVKGAKGLPQQRPYSDVLLRTYLEGKLENQVRATTSRPSFNAIVGEKKTVGVDFDDIQKAIDVVAPRGGGTIFIKRGIYYPKSPIRLENNITLEGEDNQNTIIDLSGADGGETFATASIGVLGSEVSINGTFTVSGAAVTGSSSLFVDHGVLPGDIFLINQMPYEILSVTSNTALTLKNAYVGFTPLFAGVRIMRAKKNIRLRNLQAINGKNARIAADAFFIWYAMNVEIADCIGQDCADGIDLLNIHNLQVHRNLFQHNTDQGIRVRGIFSGNIAQNKSFNNGSSGMIVTNTSSTQSLFATNNYFGGNGAHGIHLFIASQNVLSGNHCVSNVDNGIFLQGSEHNTMVGNHIQNNDDWGILLDNQVSVQSDANLIVGNHIIDNTDGSVRFDVGADNNYAAGNYNSTSMSDAGSGNAFFENWS